MNTTSIEPIKVLAIYPCTRGFSYAVMEDALTINEINTVSPKEFDRGKLLRAIKRIVETHKPITLVLEDCECKFSRKGKRSKNLINEVSQWAIQMNIPVKKYSRNQLRTVFEKWYAKTKYEIALVICRNVPELQQYMYEKPKYPEREGNSDSLFCAVSLGVTHFFMS